MKRQKIDGPFIARRYKMLNSPAFKKLSPTAHLVLLRLEMEYARSGGRENGRIICTVRDLKAFCGVSADKIKPAIMEAMGLGFLKVKWGVPGAKGFGRSTEFGLTYLVKVGEGGEFVEPTDDWAKFDTTEQVVAVKSRLQTGGKRASPVYPVRNTRTVYPGRNTVVPDSSNGCDAKTSGKSQISVPIQEHDLDSSNPAKSTGEVAEVVTMRRTG
jgi:hypothetical protein